MSHNQLSSLDGVRWSQLCSLRTICLRGNFITSFSFDQRSLPPSLTALDLSGNKIAVRLAESRRSLTIH